MYNCISDVTEFMNKHGVPINLCLSNHKDCWGTLLLDDLGQMFELSVKQLTKEINEASEEDDRVNRMRLLLSEVGKLFRTIAKADEAEFADALADLIYASVGSAIAYHIPMSEVFEEVHRSNMTIPANGDYSEFEAPDIQSILDMHKPYRSKDK